MSTSLQPTACQPSPFPNGGTRELVNSPPLREGVPGGILFPSLEILLFLVFLFASTAGANATSPRDLLASAKEFYEVGKFSEAMELYDRALELMPDSPEILFNKGNAHFQRGEFEKARHAYGRAALLSENRALEAKAHFNMGCAAGREALQGDKSEREALELIDRCIRHYKEALRLDAGYRSEAGRGIESARLATFRIREKVRPDPSSKNRDKTLPDGSTEDSQNAKTGVGAGNASGQPPLESPEQQSTGTKYKSGQPSPRETPADIMREEAENSGKFRRSVSSGNTARKDW
jgi:tetratricopeptide (TPR) repeat protein